MVAFVHLLAVAGPVFIIASLAMPAGIGGGMLYVPLLIVTHVADPRLAAVLAQPIIVGAAMAGELGEESLKVRSFFWPFGGVNKRCPKKKGL